MKSLSRTEGIVLKALFGVINLGGLVTGVSVLALITSAKKDSASIDLNAAISHANREDLITLVSDSENAIRGLLHACQMASLLAIVVTALNILLFAIYILLKRRISNS